MGGLHPVFKPLAVVAVVAVAVVNTSDLRKFGHFGAGLTTTVSSENCVSAGFTFKRQCPRGARFLSAN